jgi:hypothetical protein
MSWLLYGTGYGSTHREKAWKLMKQLGAAKAIVSYSGGNDEGGITDIRLLDAAGELLQELPSWAPQRESQEWDPETKTWSKKVIELTPEQELTHMFDAEVDAHYGSFAGEFYVSGEFTWDLATRKVEDHGQREYTYSEGY